MALSTLEGYACDWHHILEAAILSGSVDNLKQSLNKFNLDENFGNTIRELEMLLSKIYEELKIKKIPIGGDMENFIVYKIVDLRFFTEEKSETQQEHAASLEDVKERINRVIKSLNYLVEKFSEPSLLDNFFVLECTSVVKHVNILKHLLRSTYNKLPWEEFEFCLVAFLMIIVQSPEADDVFKLVLDTNRVLGHMNTFECGLEKVKSTLNKKDINKKMRLVGRGQFIQSVTNFDDNFKSLYDDYSLIKDISSLRRIDSYIRVCVDLDFDRTEPLDKLIIERTLQVIGECLKDTPDSPNISQEVQKTLNKYAPKDLKEIITSLRDSLSHTEVLSEKVEMEHKKSIKFFRDVQNDLKKIHFEISDLLWRRKLAAGGAFAKKVLDCSSLQQVRSLTKTLGRMEEEMGSYKGVTLKELEEAQCLFKELEGLLEEEPEVIKLVQRVSDLLGLQNNKIRVAHINYHAGLYILNTCIDEIEYNDNLKFIQNLSKLVLDLIEKDLQLDVFKDIAPIIWEIRSQINKKPYNATKAVNETISQILDLIVMRSDRIDDINRLQINLEKEEEDEALTKYKEIIEIMMDNARKCLVPESQQSFKKAFQMKKDLHEAKSELILIIKSKKPNEGANPIVIERCEQLAKALKMKKNNETNFLKNFSFGDINICKSLVSIIDDTYGLLLDYISEFNVFSYKKQVKVFGNFLSSLKLKNLPIEDIMKKFADENLKQIKHFYANRLNLLKTTLLDDNLEDPWDAMGKFRSSKKIQVATELMLLDMLNVLEDSSFFIDNKLYLDDYIPIPLGKALRNYLAHGNFLIDVLPFNVPLTIVSNAIKLISEGDNLIEKENISIGKRIENETFRVADVFEQMKFTMTSWHKKDEVDRANLLEHFVSLGQGAKLQGININDWTDLHYAAAADNMEAFTTRMESFPDLESQHALLSEVLHVAIMYRSSKIVDYFLSRFDFDDPSELMRFAAACGNVETVASLTNHYADLNLENIFCIAAVEGHKDIIELLLRNKIKDMENLFAKGLNYASKNGHREIVEMLLSNNFDPNAAVEEYASPLYLAIRNGHTDIVDILLKSGAKINRSVEEETVNLIDEFKYYFFQMRRTMSMAIICEEEKLPLLHLACIFGHKDIVEILLNNSLDINQKTSKIFTPLHVAVACNQVDTLQLLIKRGANVNSIPENTFSPLHLAAKNGSCEIIDLLLINGADLDIVGLDKVTPLQMACLYGHDEAVQLLIARGSDINAKTSFGKTALEYACSKIGNTNIVEDLLKRGAEIDSSDRKGTTPLHVASSNGNLDAVTLLLRYKANVDSTNKDEVTPLHFACSSGFIDVVNILLKFGADVNECDANGNTALMFALKGSYCDTAECLLEKGADVNVYNRVLVTPLHLATKNGLSDIVDTLIAKGADCNLRTLDDACPLDAAITFGYKRIVCSLLLAGADVNGASTNGSTPLCLASRFGHTNIVNILLANGADVNEKDEEDISPLHEACESGYKEIVEILLEAGADIAARDDGECTPLNIACLRGNTDVVRVLLENGSDTIINLPNSEGESPLFSAAESGSEELINLLLSKGARMDTVDSDGYTVLHNAAHNGREKVSKIFLDAGIPAGVQASDGVTPLHMAAEDNSTQVIEMLLAHGAQVDEMSSENFSPLHTAAQSGSKEAVEVLLKAGAKISQWTNEGLTEIHYAAQNKDPDIIRMLLLKGADIDCFTRNVKKTTPLHYAALLGHEKVASFLIENGAKIDIENWEGKTPLCIASGCKNKNVECILKKASSGSKNSQNKNTVEQNLLSTEEDLEKNMNDSENPKPRLTEAQDKNKTNANSNNCTEERNPLTVEDNSAIKLRYEFVEALNDVEDINEFLLHVAVLSDDEAAVTVLLSQNVDLTKPLKGMLPLHLAAGRQNIDIFNCLLAQTHDVNVATDEGLSSLHIAASNGCVEILEIVLEKGGYIEALTLNKCTPLHFAAKYGQIETLSILIEHGADVYARNSHDTVLHCATSSVEALKLILDVMKKDEKLDAINAKDEDGDTPLMWAIECQSPESATMLLEYGSDVNIQNNDGNTVLHWCVHVGNLDLLEIMLKQPGVNTRSKDKNNKTAFDLFEERHEYWSHIENNRNKTELVKSMLEKY